jgi:selenocysteine lyase/cysteine desulfurase
MYHSKAPDNPGGGTVDWTNPWGEYKYIDDIEAREDGGTPGFLQAIRAALAIELKEQMGVEMIRQREEQLVKTAFEKLERIPGVNILAGDVHHRLGCISFYVDDIHYNLFVKLLSDRFGIQVRGGCACAGTYGHFLLNVSREQSKAITDQINRGDLSRKPGWVRLSLHPTMTDRELFYMMDAIEQIVHNAEAWGQDYHYLPATNEFYHKTFADKREQILKEWFKL